MTQPPSLEGPEAYLRALQDPAQTLLELFRNDPEGLAKRLGLKLPEKPLVVMRQMGLYKPELHGPITPGLREMVLDVCAGDVEAAAACAGRGTGKSLGVSFIEFVLWMIKSYDALNLGGSELQAQNVYAYLLSFIDSDPQWRDMLKDEPKISETEKLDKAWIRVLTASQKSVRSPHAGGIRNVRGEMVERGGLLVIDEEAECEPGIVDAALPTVNTARPSVTIRCSTFQNNEGTFAELMEDPEEAGYKAYNWDVFDVAERCECTGDACQSAEKCFREDHYEDYEDPESGEIRQKLMHRAYCGGRSMYADGWIRQSEILKLWKGMRRNHAKWEVEAMGSRPPSKGHVIKDLRRFDLNFVNATPEQMYQPGSPIVINVDWGSRNAGVSVWQRQWADGGDRHVQLHSDLVEEAGQTQIFGVILYYWNKYPEAQEVRADLGGGGDYLNPKLRDEERIPTVDVKFAEMKEGGVAVWNLMQEQEGEVVYLSEQEEFRRQVRKWKRKNGRIQKGDDHLCDVNVCYFSKFIDDLGFSNLRVAPRSFEAGVSVVQQPMGFSKQSRPEASPRVPVVRGFGR